MSYGPEDIGVKRVIMSGDVTLIFRTENTGMDVGSHNVTLGYLQHKKKLWWVQGWRGRSLWTI